MITSLLISTFSIFIKLIDLIVPNWGFPLIVLEALNGVFGIIYFMDIFLNIEMMFFSLLMIFGYFASLYGLQLFWGLMSLFRGGGQLKM